MLVGPDTFTLIFVGKVNQLIPSYYWANVVFGRAAHDLDHEQSMREALNAKANRIKLQHKNKKNIPLKIKPLKAFQQIKKIVL